MKRLVKITLISVVSIATAALLFVLLLIVWIDMNQRGSLPWNPLERWSAEVPVATGGLIELSAVEDRGALQSYGFEVTASYRPPEGATSEKFGFWWGISSSTDPKAYVSGPHLVVLSPDQKTIYVRVRDQMWKAFTMDFPSERDLSRGSLSVYSNLIGISEGDLEKVRFYLDEESRQYDPAVVVEDFEPLSRILIVSYFAKAVYRLSLRLSDDGTTLDLIDIRTISAPLEN